MTHNSETISLPGARLGLLSDSHGRVDATRTAIARLLDAQADVILHLGDVCGERIIDELAGLERADGRPVPARLLFGNMDFNIPALTRYAQSLGVFVDHPAGSYTMAGRRLFAHHGHIASIMASLHDANYDYAFHGHTHELRDQRIGDLRIINPGALFKAKRRTAAILDCDDDRLDIIDIDDPA